ncbi:MAG: phosphoribosylanthranilate isomerase [Fibrobacteres bacterium]|nr:phosphoribosylanthranilate isomerase [Fibrobacterota bacterium]
MACVHQGVDHIGLNFVPQSKRFVQPDVARGLAAQVARRCGLVGVFMDQPLEYIESVLRKVPLDAVQLHGRETPEFCSRLSVPVWKVFAVGPGWDPRNVSQYPDAAVRLFDTASSPGVSGGVGKAFDWSLLPSHILHPWVLAGGLGPENLAQAITLHQPDGVDLNSGVESAPGVKDPEKLAKAMGLVAAWRTQSVGTVLPGRTGGSMQLDGKSWAVWVLDARSQTADVEFQGLKELLSAHPRLILDFRARNVSTQMLGSELLGWEMAARENGGEIRFRFNEDTLGRLMRVSLGALLPVVDEP